jgi:hypothetical protein
MQYTKPNLEHEWMEALRYREFEKMGKDKWLETASKDYTIISYNKIKDKLGNVDLDFDSLEDEKKKRFEVAFKKDKVEIPIAVKFSENDYDLLGGNTRLAGLISKGVDPKIYVVDLTKKEDIDETEKLKGGLSDGKTLEDVAKKHKMDVDLLKVQLNNGIKLEKGEHTDDKKTAEEIALDHLWENPTYYIDLKKADIDEKSNPYEEDDDKDDIFPSGSSDWRKKKTETKEMDSGSSGSFEGPLFGTVKRKINEDGIGSSGEYDVPFLGKSPKGRANPLKIGGPDTIYKNRAVKDKKWPRFGGPKGIYVKVKEKCKKFPYCNQGNTGALEFIHEDKELLEAIKETSKKYGIPYSDMENIVLNEINKIFI